jgi:tRNA threonylcarbamoyladenosine biosynthesis protein TsaE
VKALTRSVEETRNLAERLARTVLRPGDLIVLAGDLGAGKTAFAQGIGRGLDVTQRVVSPTFTIVREYEGKIPMVHVDVYRLDRLQELHDLGFDELFDESVTLIEWGDVIGALLPPDRLEIRLEAAEENERWVSVTMHGRSWQARSRQIADVWAAFPPVPAVES